MHCQGLQFIPLAHGRYLAEHIAGAQLAILPGSDGINFSADHRHHVENFLGGLTRLLEPDRAFAAILFTDLVGSTQQAAALGDQAWRNFLETHNALFRTLVDQHKGRVVKMTGDGMLATFDGPGRAIRDAMALGDALRPLDLEIQAGLHTGEVEVMGADIAGIGVHTAAQVLGPHRPPRSDVPRLILRADDMRQGPLTPFPAHTRDARLKRRAEKGSLS